MTIQQTSLILCAAVVLTACSGDDNNEPSPPMSSLMSPPMATFEVAVTNLTAAQPLSPMTLAVASPDWSLFELAEPASVALELIAESGDNSALLAELGGNAQVMESISGTGVVMPGMTATFEISVPESDLDQASLSAVTMLVNTNDALTAVRGVALDAIELGGSVRQSMAAYDAGTESNSELAATIPGPAAGGEGFNAERDDSDRILVHPGVVGVLGGRADSVLNEEHRFDNPVAGIVITRIE